MIASDIEMLKTNIEYLVDVVTEIHGLVLVSFIFSKYGAHSLDDLDPAKYSEVYSELQYYSMEYWEGEER